MSDESVVPGVPRDPDELVRLRAENDSLRAALDRRRRWRGVLALVLVILTSLTVVSASVAVWVHQVVFDTDRFMETVEPVLDDPDFYIILGDRASESVISALAIEERLVESLAALDEYLSETILDALDVGDPGRRILDGFDRPSLSELAPPIAGAVESRIEEGVEAFFTSEAFVGRFPGLVRQAHAATVSLARDELAELPNVYLEDGEVRLNLVPFIGEALRQVADEVRAVIPEFDPPTAISERAQEGRQQLEAALQTTLPPEFGQFTVMSESTLSEIQDTASQLDRYVWVLVPVALLLLVLALVVSPNRRRTALQLGLGVFIAVVVASVTVRQIEEAIVSAIEDPRGAALAGDIVDGTLSGLRTLELAIAVVAVVIALTAYLAGRPSWLSPMTSAIRDWTRTTNGVSRLDTWIAAHAGVLRAVGSIVATGALFLVGLSLTSVLVIGVILAGFLLVISNAERRMSEASVAAHPPD